MIYYIILVNTQGEKSEEAWLFQSREKADAKAQELRKLETSLWVYEAKVLYGFYPELGRRRT